MTDGEARLARSVFTYGLDTTRVRVHGRPYLIGQGRGVAMSPNGEVWFRREDYRADFSRNILDAAWLVHELTHVWQYQSGRSTRVRGLIEQLSRVFGSDPYHYGDLDPSRPFATYKNEQQAAIVEDYYLARMRRKPRNGTASLAVYERVIPFVPKTIVAQKLAKA